MQARLLQAVAGLAIGSRDLYLESEMTRSILAAAARRANLLRSLKAQEHTSLDDSSRVLFEGRQAGDTHSNSGQEGAQHSVQEETEDQLEARWYRWLEEEEKRRLGWGIYVSADQSAESCPHTLTYLFEPLRSWTHKGHLSCMCPRHSPWTKSMPRCRQLRSCGSLLLPLLGMQLSSERTVQSQHQPSRNLLIESCGTLCKKVFFPARSRTSARISSHTRCIGESF